MPATTIRGSISRHSARAIAGAIKRGAAAGRPEARELWLLPKRALLEAALHLAARGTDSYDEAMAIDGGAQALRDEIANLKQHGLI